MMLRSEGYSEFVRGNAAFLWGLDKMPAMGATITWRPTFIFRFSTKLIQLLIQLNQKGAPEYNEIPLC